jgi:hypothetical protein
MRTFRFLNLAILSVLVGSAALVYAQDEKPQEDKPARQEEATPQPKQDEAKPSRPEEAKPSRQDKQERKQDEKRGQEQSHEQAMPDRQEHPEMQGDHARQGQGQEHPEVQNGHARPAGKGGHIPDDKFRSHFGREHHFSARTVIVSGRPQFQYGGYSFELVDAWPADWAYTDDCYIDYIDGEYFLFDLLHPGVRVAVFVVM